MRNRLLLAGFATGLLSAAGYYIGVHLLGYVVYFYLLIGPSILFSLGILFGFGMQISASQRASYIAFNAFLYILTAAFFLYIQVSLGYRLSVILASMCSGGFALANACILTRSLPWKPLALAVVLTAAVGVISPLSGSYVMFADFYPAPWLLFPLWQTIVAGCIGLVLDNSDAVAVTE